MRRAKRDHSLYNIYIHISGFVLDKQCIYTLYVHVHNKCNIIFNNLSVEFVLCTLL